jgi:hypothetical protein
VSFDRNNTADLQALYDERTINPLGMQYPANDNTFVSNINDPSKNVGGETVARQFDVEAMLDALDPNDLDAQQTVVGADVYTSILASLGGVDIEAYKAKWRSMFAANSNTVNALDAQTTPISRARVLWDDVIVVDDWIAARIFVEGS